MASTDRYIINGLRLAAKLMTNTYLELSAQDQQDRADTFNLCRNAINDEIVKRQGTPYVSMEIEQ